MVRVAELLEAVRDAPGRPRTAGDLLPSDVLDRVGVRMRELVERQSSVVAELLAELAQADVEVLPVSAVEPSERGELAATFYGTIFPVLTPLAVGPGRPFPYISNLSLSLGVTLRDPETGQRRLARVKVPEVLPRFLRVGTRGDRFVTLEDLIAAHLDSLFPGMEVEEHAAFRVTRDADFEIEESPDDLLSAVERELRRRRFGEVVRVELASSMSAEMRSQLLAHLHAEDAYVVSVDGLLDLADIVELAGLERSELRYPDWQGVTRPRLRGEGDKPSDIFAAIREGDILVDHPYDDFSTSVERLIEAAVDDSERARDQAHDLPHLGRLADGAGADPRGRAGQAGGRARRAQGALRRGPQHRLGARAGARRRARRARLPRAQDARQVRARGAPRARRHPPLRAHRHRQLPPAHRAPLHRRRPLHVPAGHRGRRLRPLQLPDRLRAPAALPQAARGADRPARAHRRRDPSRDRGRGGRAPRVVSC